MSPIEIQKEIIKLGGIREIYKSCRDIDSIFGKKKSQVLRDIIRFACYSYNTEEPRIKELLENINNIKFDVNGDYKEYLRRRNEANKAYQDYINNCPTPMYKIKDDFILYISKDDYSKSHATYYSPILMEAFIEIDKIMSPYENYPRLERNEQIELYKKVVEILLKFDCIEKEIY